MWTAQGCLDLLRIQPVGFRAVSYLPMAHIAERMSGHYLAGIGGYEVPTCPDPALLASYLREVHPQTRGLSRRAPSATSGRSSPRCWCSTPR